MHFTELLLLLAMLALNVPIHLESNHSKIVEVQLLCTTDSPPKFLSDLPQTSCACAPIVPHMHKNFEVNWK